METISVNGETFVKASILARELGYTSDYVGQLCRGGKVKAELVGRSWYVEPDSLKLHKKSRYRSVAKKTEKQIREEVSRRSQVEEVIAKPNFYSKLHHPDVRYFEDQDEVFPTLKPREAREVESEESNFQENIEEYDDSHSNFTWSQADEPDVSQNDDEFEANTVAINLKTSSEQPKINKRTNLKGRLDIVAVDSEGSVPINSHIGKKSNSVDVYLHKAPKKPSGGFKMAVTALFVCLTLTLAGGLLLTESRVSSANSYQETYNFNWQNYHIFLDFIRENL